MKSLIGIAILLIATNGYCGSIGFGKVVAIKQYDLGTDNTIKLYLASDATDINENCIENGKIYGRITPSSHTEDTINRMFSMATAAYMSGKKLRLHSETDSCEVDFVALQEAVF